MRHGVCLPGECIVRGVLGDPKTTDFLCKSCDVSCHKRRRQQQENIQAVTDVLQWNKKKKKKNVRRSENSGAKGVLRRVPKRRDLLLLVRRVFKECERGHGEGPRSSPAPALLFGSDSPGQTHRGFEHGGSVFLCMQMAFAKRGNPQRLAETNRD